MQDFPFERLKLRDDGGPLFRQLERRLEKLIHRGVLQSGQQLPPASKMAEYLNVNRLTVVHALQRLCDRKLLVVSTISCRSLSKTASNATAALTNGKKASS